MNNIILIGMPGCGKARSALFWPKILDFVLLTQIF